MTTQSFSAETADSKSTPYSLFLQEESFLGPDWAGDAVGLTLALDFFQTTDGWDLVKEGIGCSAADFEALLASHRGLLLGSARCILGNLSARREPQHMNCECEDLLQEALLKAWRVRHSVPRSPEGWRRYVTTAMLRLVFNETSWRKRRRPYCKGLMSLEKAETASSAEEISDELDRWELAKTLRVALSRLPANHAKAIDMVCLQGLSFSEFGKIFGVAHTTASRRVRRGLELLRAQDTALGGFLQQAGGTSGGSGDEPAHAALR